MKSFAVHKFAVHENDSKTVKNDLENPSLTCYAGLVKHTEIEKKSLQKKKTRLSAGGLGLIALLGLQPHEVQADLFHYSNLLIGPRAMGMGGAFAALSDDTSGLYYNPGGMALQTSTELSSSINTFYLKSNTFDRVFGEKAFEETARGSLSTFFGFSKKITPPVLGTLQVGIAFVNPDSALSDENALVENEPATSVKRYHRAANIRSGSSQVIVGAAKRIGKDFGLGCAASYLDVDELEQIYQDVVQGPFTFEELPGKAVYSTLGQNVRVHLVLRGGALRCGFRTSFEGGVRLGLSYQRSEMVYQKLDYDSEINKVFTDENNVIVDSENTENQSLKGQLLRSVIRTSTSRFVEQWPDEIRLGLAYQPWRPLLLSADVVRMGPGKGTIANVKRAETINFSAGAELLLGSLVFVRGGYFTNSDATASRDLSSPDQRREYMDYRGVAVSTGLKLRSGEYGVHYAEQRGKGMAEKVAGKKESSSGRLQVISISASQSFP